MTIVIKITNVLLNNITGTQLTKYIVYTIYITQSVFFSFTDGIRGVKLNIVNRIRFQSSAKTNIMGIILYSTCKSRIVPYNGILIKKLCFGLIQSINTDVT